MNDLQELLERVKNATEHNRELDADIATALGFKIEWKMANYIMELRPVIDWPPHGREPCPQFTASIDAALALVERKLPGWAYAIIHEEGRGNVAYVHNNQSAFEGWSTRPNPNRRWHEVRAATPALAILAALLSALSTAHKGET
jgi:hypothetical protein